MVLNILRIKHPLIQPITIVVSHITQGITLRRLTVHLPVLLFPDIRQRNPQIASTLRNTAQKDTSVPVSSMTRTAPSLLQYLLDQTRRHQPPSRLMHLIPNRLLRWPHPTRHPRPRPLTPITTQLPLPCLATMIDSRILTLSMISPRMS